jgi:UDP:flavonoid glycosyltransferase YjiC (YdhE family)
MRNVGMKDKPLMLVFPHNVMAHYLRCLQLAKHLQEYFTVGFLSSEEYNSFVEKAGFETFECAKFDAQRVLLDSNNFSFSWLNYSDICIIFQQQVEVLSKLKPVAVLGDTSPTLAMAAELKNVFHISLLNGYMTRLYANGRRIPSSYPLYKVFRLLPGTLSGYLTTVGEQISFYHIHRPFSKLRRRFRLDVRHSYLQEIEGNLNLICDLPEIFPQRNLPSGYQFIPPLFHQTNVARQVPTSAIDASNRTILVTMGSTGNWQSVSFLNDQCFSKYNIVTAGDAQGVIRGNNVIAIPFIEDESLFEHSDLAICHGGNGTIYQCLSFGIPVLCQTANFEQEYNLDGIERLGYGMRINNVNSAEAHALLIEEWISKKQESKFTEIKQGIRHSRENLPEIIENIARKVLNAQLVRAAIEAPFL